MQEELGVNKLCPYSWENARMGNLWVCRIYMMYRTMREDENHDRLFITDPTCLCKSKI